MLLTCQAKWTLCLGYSTTGVVSPELATRTATLRRLSLTTVFQVCLRTALGRVNFTVPQCESLHIMQYSLCVHCFTQGFAWCIAQCVKAVQCVICLYSNPSLSPPGGSANWQTPDLSEQGMQDYVEQDDPAYWRNFTQYAVALALAVVAIQG